MAPNDIRYEKVSYPKLGPGDLIIKVLNANICGTDLRILHGGHRHYPEGTIRIPGHEVVGEIVAVGEKAGKYKLGERVFIAPNMGEGDSRETISGNNNWTRILKRSVSIWMEHLLNICWSQRLRSTRETSCQFPEQGSSGCRADRTAGVCAQGSERRQRKKWRCCSRYGRWSDWDAACAACEGKRSCQSDRKRAIGSPAEFVRVNWGLT